MDYYQGIVAEYLRADRAMFINTEFFLRLHGEPKEPVKGTSWYVDIVAISFKESAVYLCEVTYSRTPSALLKKLGNWSERWSEIVDALKRDTGVPPGWKVRPWIFIPEEHVLKFVEKTIKLPIIPRVTTLQMTQPWQYCTWDRQGEMPKPISIPPEMSE